MTKFVFTWIFLAFLPAPALATCVTEGILGYPPEVSNKCVEDRGDVGPADFGVSTSPSCQTDFSMLAAQEVMAYSAKHRSPSAFDYAGSVTGLIAGTADTRLAAKQALDNLHMGSNSSGCRALCVKLPAGAAVIDVRGMARDERSHGGMPGYCPVD